METTKTDHSLQNVLSEIRIWNMLRVFIKELNNRLISENNRLGRGWRGPPRPPLGPGQRPGRGPGGRSPPPRLKTKLSFLKPFWRALLAPFKTNFYPIKHDRIRKKAILVSIVFGVVFFLNLHWFASKQLLFPKSKSLSTYLWKNWA